MSDQRNTQQQLEEARRLGGQQARAEIANKFNDMTRTADGEIDAEDVFDLIEADDDADDSQDGALTPGQIRQMSPQEIEDNWDAVSEALQSGRSGAPRTSGPLTIDAIREMSADEIEARWPEVERVIGGGQ